MNSQATELNEIIRNENSVVYELLAKRGKKIFFPSKGIIAQAADAKGKEINATIGAAIEDDGSPMRLRVVENGINISPEFAFPYASSFGREDLKTQWESMLYKKNFELIGKEISLPIVTNALTHGLSVIGYLFIDENDEIILPDLYWGNYNLIFASAYDAVFNKFNLFRNNNFDLISFKNILNNNSIGKKILLLNFPNNPTGYTPTIDEVKNIALIIKESAEKGNKILVIIDDAYFGLVYEDGIEKKSIFSDLADIHENVLAVKIDGATKEDYVWGFRVGFITYGIKNGTKELYSSLTLKTAGTIRGSISNVSNLSQSLLLNAYKNCDYEKEKKEKYEILKLRYKKVKNELQENEKYKEYFKPFPFNSGYFMCIQLKEGLDAEKVRSILLEKYNTGVISLKNIIRIAYSSISITNINKLFKNIYSACRDSLKLDENKTMGE